MQLANIFIAFTETNQPENFSQRTPPVQINDHALIHELFFMVADTIAWQLTEVANVRTNGSTEVTRGHIHSRYVYQGQQYPHPKERL